MNKTIQNAEDVVEVDIAHGVSFLDDYKKDLSNLQVVLGKACDKAGVPVDKQDSLGITIQDLLDNVDNYKKSCYYYNLLVNNAHNLIKA